MHSKLKSPRQLANVIYLQDQIRTTDSRKIQDIQYLSRHQNKVCRQRLHTCTQARHLEKFDRKNLTFKDQ
ncbi:hypothetical protein Mapa_005416 [Marchantia paleacea]|nr:hypothetical protein Mapa_005416 [Marchantia paleacea]